MRELTPVHLELTPVHLCARRGPGMRAKNAERDCMWPAVSMSFGAPWW